MRPPSLLLTTILLLDAREICAKKKRRRQAETSVNAQAMNHHQRGVMAHVQGDPNAAKREFRKAIAAAPNFAYAYYRLGFVMQEQEQQERERHRKDAKKLRATEDPVPIFRAAIAIDGHDEMAYYALGQTLKERSDMSGAAAVFETIASRLNPLSAQAYWALGHVRALTRDEFESDPGDEDDPSHCYEMAATLQPAEYAPDGARTRRVEPMTPEREERLERESRERRETFLADLTEGRRTIRYAGEANVP